MFQVFNAKTADAAWSEIMRHHQAGGFSSGQGSRSGLTDELLHAAICIENSRQRWISCRKPPMNIAFALVEVIWIVRGRNDSAFLNYFNSKLPQFAGNEPTYSGAYGWRLKRRFRMNQLHRTYETLKRNPDSRQAVLQIWDPRLDLPKSNGAPRSQDIPCNLSACLKVRNGKLEWLQTMRSNDMFRGLPHNIVQFTTLQEIMAGWLGVEPGAYHHLSDSLHLYRVDVDQIEIGASSVQNNDDLRLEKWASDRALAALEQLVEKIISPTTSVKALKEYAETFPGTIAYKNIARVLCAEGARRRKCPDQARAIMAYCENLAFSNLFDAWLERVESTRSLKRASDSGGL